MVQLEHLYVVTAIIRILCYAILASVLMYRSMRVQMFVRVLRMVALVLAYRVLAIPLSQLIPQWDRVMQAAITPVLLCAVWFSIEYLVQERKLSEENEG